MKTIGNYVTFRHTNGHMTISIDEIRSVESDRNYVTINGSGVLMKNEIAARRLHAAINRMIEENIKNSNDYVNRIIGCKDGLA